MKMSQKNIQNIGSSTVHNESKTYIAGSCSEMCPFEEVALRKREKLVHILEVTESVYRFVKSYSRSAASANMAVPRFLRPFPVLLDVVHYLFLEVSNRLDVKMTVIYDFLNDRLRAVRQDMTIQRLPPEECVILLEPMIRFYIYYGYRFCEYPLNEYDPVLNKKYLLECMKWYLSCCDNIEQNSSDIISLNDSFATLDINKRNHGKLSCDRVLVESLYVLCNLDDIQPIYRYLKLPKYIKRASAIKLAYNIAVANLHGNFIRMWKLTKGLCPLTYSAFCLYLPTLQRKGLQVMSHAYNSKQLTVPVKVVQQWLAFNTAEEVRSACEHYGLKASDGVNFNKNNFKVDVDKPPPKKHYQAKITQLKLEDILFYML